MTNLEMQRAGEDAAASYLERKGMQVLVRNWRLKMGEIDIVAYDGEILVFVEVKARGRSDFIEPSLVVTYPKQKKLKRLAEAFVSFENPSFKGYRFDVVSVVADRGAPLVNHIPDAF